MKDVAKQLKGIGSVLLSGLEFGALRCPPKWRAPIADFFEAPIDLLFDERGTSLGILLPQETVDEWERRAFKREMRKG
jgi:hypothetical protein